MFCYNGGGELKLTLLLFQKQLEQMILNGIYYIKYIEKKNMKEKSLLALKEDTRDLPKFRVGTTNG